MQHQCRFLRHSVQFMCIYRRPCPLPRNFFMFLTDRTARPTPVQGAVKNTPNRQNLKVQWDYEESNTWTDSCWSNIGGLDPCDPCSTDLLSGLGAVCRSNCQLEGAQRVHISAKWILYEITGLKDIRITTVNSEGHLTSSMTSSFDLP